MPGFTSLGTWVKGVKIKPPLTLERRINLFLHQFHQNQSNPNNAIQEKLQNLHVRFYLPLFLVAVIAEPPWNLFGSNLFRPNQIMRTDIYIISIDRIFISLSICVIA